MEATVGRSTLQEVNIPELVGDNTIFDFTSDLLTSYNDNLDVIAIYIDLKKLLIQ